VYAGEFQEIGEGRRDAAAITGQAILSRYPISAPATIRFENQARLRWKLDPTQPRRGGRIALRAETAGLVLYNAHIESAKNDRFRHKQIDEMLIDRLKMGRPDVPVVFAGDFNTLDAPDDSAIVRCLTVGGFVDALGGADQPRRTSIHHVDPLDWIFVQNLTPRAGRVVADIARASDHYPLLTDVQVPLRVLAADQSGLTSAPAELARP
jgi:endonuclease/exonuclease/phosphatase family metal-dependent hydrolase